MFQIGDRVIVNKSYDTYDCGYEGTVIGTDKDPYPYLVQLDNRTLELNGLWYFNENELDLM